MYAPPAATRETEPSVAGPEGRKRIAYGEPAVGWGLAYNLPSPGGAEDDGPYLRELACSCQPMELPTTNGTLGGKVCRPLSGLVDNDDDLLPTARSPWAIVYRPSGPA